MRLKSAPLDLILQANNIPTGDELRLQRAAALAERLAAERAQAPIFLNSQQRRSLRKVLAKANQPQDLTPPESLT